MEFSVEVLRQLDFGCRLECPRLSSSVIMPSERRLNQSRKAQNLAFFCRPLSWSVGRVKLLWLSAGGNLILRFRPHLDTINHSSDLSELFSDNSLTIVLRRADAAWP